MNFIEIFDELINENTPDRIEGTNEITEGLWFNSGIKNAGSDTIYWTTIGDAIEQRNPVAQLGTIIEIPISKHFYSLPGLLPSSYELPSEQLLLSSKNVGLYIAMTEATLDRNAYIYTKEPPIAFATVDDARSSDYQDSRSQNPMVRDSHKGFRVEVATWNESHGAFNPHEVVYSEPSNAYWNGSPSALRENDIVWYWSHSRALYSSGNGLSHANASVRNGICYLKCVAYRDDENEKICITPLLSGFIVAVDNYTNDTYHIDCIDKDYIITRIPYSVLNNTNYFDPEKDAGDPRPDEEDPGYENDNSRPGGGGGNYINYPSDDIGFPPLPTVSAIDTGFLTMYNPSTGALQSLVDYLWTSDWVDNIKKMVANPMDAIISLQLAPYNIETIVSSQCKIGAINTDIVMSKVTNQYQILNCGVVSVPEHWGNALDYNNVNISIYIPFVGVRSLDTNLIMNSTVGLAYYVDLLTGGAIAMLIVRKKGTSESIYYTFDCNLNYQIPLTGANYAETMKALLSMGASAVGAGMALQAGNASAALGATSSMIGSAFMAGSGAHHYEGAGNLSANTGLMGQFTPYMIIELPKQSLPKNFKSLKGYTSNITATLGTLSGYTVVESVHVDNIPGATDREKEMIEDLLKGGVIL